MRVIVLCVIACAAIAADLAGGPVARAQGPRDEVRPAPPRAVTATRAMRGRPGVSSPEGHGEPGDTAPPRAVPETRLGARTLAPMHRAALRKALVERARLARSDGQDAAAAAREARRRERLEELQGRFGGPLPRPLPDALRLELWRHARRMSRVGHVELTALRVGNPALTARATKLKQRELERHGKALERLFDALRKSAADAGVPDAGAGSGGHTGSVGSAGEAAPGGATPATNEGKAP